MKKQAILSALVAALIIESASGQNQPPPTANIPTRALSSPGQNQPEPPKLTTFSLDFPGGTPGELVAAIEKAMGKPLNAIIPVDQFQVRLPPLKMSNVDVSQLFQALELTSMKTEAYVTGTTYSGGYGGGQQSYQQMRTSYGFRTPGAHSDESIWYFYMEKPNMPPLVSPIPKICRFYPLTSFLDRGMTVDDITTAIQTGWKMLGDKETPTISFHKETKLLIAVGEPGKLQTIDAVLEALKAPPVTITPDPFRGLMQPPTPALPATGTTPKPASQPKLESK